jgi:hypothetical protein
VVESTVAARQPIVVVMLKTGKYFTPLSYCAVSPAQSLEVGGTKMSSSSPSRKLLRLAVVPANMATAVWRRCFRNRSHRQMTRNQKAFRIVFFSRVLLYNATSSRYTWDSSKQSNTVQQRLSDASRADDCFSSTWSSNVSNAAKTFSCACIGVVVGGSDGWESYIVSCE